MSLNHRLQSNFESSAHGWIYEAELFKLYQTKFAALGPMLRSADLVTVSRVGFPKMEMALIQEVEGQPPVQVIKGISKKSWIDFTGGKEKYQAVNIYWKVSPEYRIISHCSALFQYLV